MDDKTLLLLLFVASGLLLIVLAIPLVLRKIKPNYFYGFRVPKTLNDSKIWFEANAYSGRQMVWSGIVFVVSAVGFYVLPGIGFQGYAWIMLAIFGVMLTITIVQSFLYLRNL